MTIKIAFLDCDGTLTKVTSSWEYLHRRLGIWDQNADHFQKLFRDGQIDYHEFCRRDALLWKGLPVSKVKEMVDEIPYQEGARETIAALKDMGIYTVIISTGLAFLVDKVKDDLGIHKAMANELLAEEGRLTGGIRIHVEYDGKGRLVEEILRERGLTREEACAVGDGEGDRGMFEAVSMPIGFHPSEHVHPYVAHALNNGSLLDVVGIIKGFM